ncbi:NAD(P)/FAD-dependent oxidoreductase [Cryobacterium psychrophilum]|uniref:FAD-binding oxidoreductase n=1 Tax=Cryobacterium psychrophilum TaxID=41988 RepID=A0A4Y8KSX0_9MICO|nr:FAD-binding oxidoreductase [Cryobacterium psychrophilum]TDW29435.1 glycine/D-amino acid oxidase-like deaminating enzyme [Cryobacterium psychrophilum]TFD81424.1 FAD-binding oxidoreductase [Cryobacterium psychrophilum]
MTSQVISLELAHGACQPAAAEVVIIGGGIMGTSIAFHLAQAGVRNIVLVEQAELGSGSSAKPLGGVRATFSDPANILLGQRSLRAYERFAAEFSTDIGLRKVGYLFLCRSGAEVSDCERSTSIQNELGSTSRMISPREATEINPFVQQDCLIGASYSPNDGFAEPGRVVDAYAAAARRLGVTILNRTEVMDVGTANGQIDSVTTNRGVIRAGSVICCAGAWSRRVGDMVGVPLPVTPVRRQIGMTRQHASPFPAVPFTLDLSTTLYFHNYYNGMLLGISNTNQSPGFSREFSYGWLPEFNAAARVCAPSLENPDLEFGWAGLYENTPDHNALIGGSDRVSGFFYATGFSGHGFLQGPAVGELMRDLYLGQEPFMDAGVFSADRFRNANQLLHEVHII